MYTHVHESVYIPKGLSIKMYTTRNSMHTDICFINHAQNPYSLVNIHVHVYRIGMVSSYVCSNKP